MIHFRNKDDLLNYLEQYTTGRTKRFIESGKNVELIGGFSHISPTNKPGWIFRLKSNWYVGITIERKFYKTKPQWQYWDGDESDNPMYQGDRPKLYRRLKYGS